MHTPALQAKATAPSNAAALANQLPNEALPPLTDYFVRRSLFVLALATVAYAAYILSDILLLAFGAILVALGFDHLAAIITRLTGLARRWAVLLGVVLIAAAVALIIAIFGAQLGLQLRSVGEKLPEAVGHFVNREELAALTKIAQGTAVGNVVAGALAWGAALVGSLAATVLVLAAGIHLALEPGRYRSGMLLLVPKNAKPIAEDAINDCSRSLKLWFGGQLVAMVIVGLLTGIGLWLLGVPAALGLGLIAGLTEFVPYLGPIAGATPAILIGATESLTMAGSAVVLFIVIQQLENNVILPLVMGRATDVPPVVGILGTLASGVLLGPLGLLLGFPLVIVTLVLVNRLYVRSYLSKAEGDEGPLGQNINPKKAINSSF